MYIYSTLYQGVDKNQILQGRLVYSINDLVSHNTFETYLVYSQIILEVIYILSQVFSISVVSNFIFQLI
jgi:hypothetical protein